MATIEVGPGLQYPTPAVVPWATLHPGDKVNIHGGPYADAVVIGSQGTAAAPIVVEGNGTTINASLVLDNAAYVNVYRLALRSSPYFGCIIQNGAHNCTLGSSSVVGCGGGVWMGNGCGIGHRILSNTLTDNSTHGVAVDAVALPTTLAQIASNTVLRNAYHGMEINGNRCIVEYNTVRDNGLGLSGTSGIHVYCLDATQGMGLFNIIRYNTVSGQQEGTGQDGNGIQLDQWCDNNQVYWNMAFSNDGAGIVLFDAASNTVYGNTLAGNGKNSGGQHRYIGDLVVAANESVNHTSGNSITGNLIYCFRQGAHPVIFDSWSAAHTLKYGGNILFGTAAPVMNGLVPSPPDLVNP